MAWHRAMVELVIRPSPPDAEAKSASIRRFAGLFSHRSAPSIGAKALARKRLYLKTIGHVLGELSRQYRRADQGTLDWADAVAAARILREMRACLEGSNLEERIAAIEATLSGLEGQHRRPNGGAQPEARM
jgi:hypothetical protein